MKKVLFTGLQPSGELTLGSYLGVMKRWPEFRNEYKCLYSIVDLHSITIPQDPKVLRERTFNFLAGYLAAGLDVNEDIIFIQSQVPEHTNLAWVLSSITYMGELGRMTQFKEKVQKGETNNNLGLFAYPVLMAADILLYNSSFVPIGEDQTQHLEIARDLAHRFNTKYGKIFVIPEMFVPKDGTARIKSLAEPTKKMSKSDENKNAVVGIFESPDAIMAKFKRAVTDMGNEIIASPEKPGITNLLNIYSAFSGISISEAEAQFIGKGYGDFKKAVGECVVEGLKDVRNEYNRLIADKHYLEKVYTDGANKAREVASKKLKEVYSKIGFLV